METWFIVSALIIFVLSFVVYAVIAIFYPEWVGISGRVAKGVEQSHEEGKSTGSDWSGD